MKQSLRFKMTTLTVASIAIIVFVALVVSNMAVVRITKISLMNKMIETYNEIDAIFEEEAESNNRGATIYEIDQMFVEVALRSDFDIIVVTQAGEIHSNILDEGKYRDNLLMLLDLLRSPESSEISEWSKPGNDDERTYFIQRNHDERIGVDYYDLIGVMSNGDLVAIRSSVSTLDSSVMIATNIFAVVAFFITLIVAIVVFAITGHYTKPIKKMAQAATSMAHLDFNTKVEVRSRDEIGDLGKSINHMSDQLKITISELKTANNELKKDVEEKKKIDEMRSEFISHVSHELKTPIALIQGYAEGLQDNINEDLESREFYCEVIIDEANKMNQLVKRLMTLNELEFGNNIISFERFNLTELVSNIIKSSKVLIPEESDVEIVFDDQKDFYVWADEFMIEEAVTNYITNAIHHVSNPGRIDITMEEMDGEVKFAVFNTGATIPEDELSKLWIKFYKMDKARTREYGGSGVGLSIVEAIIKQHDKEYGAYNKEDGVCFYFTLDMDKKEEQMVNQLTKKGLS